MTKNEIKQTMIDKFIEYMDSWYEMDIFEEETARTQAEKEAAHRLANDYYTQAITIEQLIKECFGDINIYDMWLDK